jgi:hypothetical protein
MRRRQAPVRPYQQKQINAGSSTTREWLSRDDDLVPLPVTSGRWRYDNLTDSIVLQDWTALTIPTPVARGEITIPAALNAMSRTYRDRQLNQVTFELTDGDGNVTQQLAFVELAAVFQGATGL